jgi:hypothetical protein
MKEKFIKIFGYLVSISIVILIIFAVFYSMLHSIQKVFSQKGISKQFEKIKEEFQKSLKEIEEKTSPKIELPQSGLKISSQIEILATSTLSFSIKSIVSENELYWKIESGSTPKSLPEFFQFLSPLIYDWRKVQISEKDVEDLKILGEILKKKWVFKKIKMINGGYEFAIDKEKFENEFLKKKKEIGESGGTLEEFLKGFKEISGKVYFERGNLIKKMEIFGKGVENESVKVVFEFENLREEMVKNKEGENFERVLISILTF